MAREGVSYDQVKAAAEVLLAKSAEPSIRAVREQLGHKGSPNTIQRHLVKWRDARPQGQAASLDLPLSIIREINSEIQRAAEAARTAIEGQLVMAKAETADLAATGEALEAERDDLVEQLTALTSARDVLAGRAQEQGAEILRLGLALERERQAVEQTRIQLERASLQLEVQAQKNDEQRHLIERGAQELGTERQARVIAERDLVAAVTARDGLAERLTDLQGREQAALLQVTNLRARADESATAASAAASDAARLQEALTRETTDAERWRAEVDQLREQLNTCRVENARLVGSRAREQPPPAESSAPNAAPASRARKATDGRTSSTDIRTSVPGKGGKKAE